MPVVSARGCQSEVSQSSSVRVREHRVDREVRVARWATVLRCVRANGVRCIRHVRVRPLVGARWAQAVREWQAVQWELDRDYHLREPRRHVRARVHLQRIAVRDSVIKARVASRKDR